MPATVFPAVDRHELDVARRHLRLRERRRLLTPGLATSSNCATADARDRKLKRPSRRRRRPSPTNPSPDKYARPAASVIVSALFPITGESFCPRSPVLASPSPRTTAPRRGRGSCRSKLSLVVSEPSWKPCSRRVPSPFTTTEPFAGPVTIWIARQVEAVVGIRAVRGEVDRDRLTFECRVGIRNRGRSIVLVRERDRRRLRTVRETRRPTPSPSTPAPPRRRRARTGCRPPVTCACVNVVIATPALATSSN